LDNSKIQKFFLKSILRVLLPVLKDNFLFFILLCVFLGTTVYYFSYVPVWDGWAYSQCYQSFAKTGTIICDGHIAIVPMVLYGLTQIFSPNNFQLAYLLNMLLGLLGLVYFYRLLKYLFGVQLSSTELCLSAFLFSLNPIFLVHILQPNLDFSLSVYFVIFIYLLISWKIELAVLVGILMVFSKETGFVIYSVGILLHLFLFRGSYFGLAMKRKDILRSVIVFLPLLLFGFYMLTNSPHCFIGSWSLGFKNILSPELINRFTVAQFAALCIINFNWIPAIFILRGFFMSKLFVRAKLDKQIQQRGFRNSTDKVYVYFLFLSLFFLLTRIKVFHNPRYILPLLPLFIILFIEAVLINLKNKKNRITVLIVFIMLTYGSAFGTWDPVAKLILGTFKFGSHDMLNMGKFYRFTHYPRDEMSYNYEFFQLPLLTDKIVSKFGLDKVYTTDYAFTWPKLNFEDLIYYDLKNKHRTTSIKNSIKVKFLPVSEILAGHFQDIYFIQYPNMENNVTLEELLSMFSVKESTVVENKGYCLTVLHLIAK
jgi:hypothetical protein